MELTRDPRLAVLFDADNVPYSNVRGMLAEIAKYGTPTFKRIYGDWTKPTVAGWKTVLLENGITPIQQYSYTSGKNATDSAMIIDAMDILYTGRVDGFCIVSSDSDFTRLATRLREAGMKVYGIGEKKTPIPFIAAMWITNLTGSKANANQFLIGAVAAIALGIYSFTLPRCSPQKSISKDSSIVEILGLNAFKLFANYKMALFFIFAMFLGAALQLTNMYGDSYLDDFKNFPQYADSFVVKYSTIIMSISQISETLFILAIPFFLKRFGIKKVILFSMIAWVLRFGLFSLGNPSNGLWMIVLSCIVYGMAFDFFNISGSLFVETTTDSKIRSSAQGLFMMMTNGFGAFFGSKVSGYVIDKYYTHAEGKDWHGIWLAFACYALVLGIIFPLVFRHKHERKPIEITEEELVTSETSIQS